MQEDKQADKRTVTKAESAGPTFDSTCERLGEPM